MPIYRDEEIEYVLNHSGAALAITVDEFKGFSHLGMFSGLRERCPQVTHLIAVRRRTSAGQPDDGITEYSSLAVSGPLVDVEAELGEPLRPDDPCLIVYTSGTTARPKGCLHTFNTMHTTARAMIEGLEYGEDDVQFGPSPITHSTGLITSILMPMSVGASSYLMDAFSPEAALQAIARHRCTVAITATAFLQILIGAYDPARHDASSMRFWVCAGSPIPGSIVERANALFGGMRAISLYGRSEHFVGTMCHSTDDPKRSSTSDGRAIPGAEIRIVGGDGAEVPRGQEGDLAYRGAWAHARVLPRPRGHRSALHRRRVLPLG